jgi:asparagine synthetase B (glutamine-hydrolysing)
LYEEYGEDFVSHLRGEFAIALLDQRNEVLYLVRDRFGIKPLFYSRLNDSLVVAASSEKLGLEKGSEFSAHYLDSSAIRNTGLFNPQVVAGLRRSLAYLPRSSRVLSLTETVLTGVASIQAINEMFCERFADSAARFSLSRADSTLADGRI